MKVKLLPLLTLALLLPPQNLRAQEAPPQAGGGNSVFSLNLALDLGLGGGGLGLFLPPQFLPPIERPFGQASEVFAFDRPLMRPYSPSLDTAGDWVMAAALAAPAFTVIPVLASLDGAPSLDSLWTYGAMYAETALLTAGAKDLVKVLVGRYRPYTYYGTAGTPYIPPGQEDDYNSSFPSGHTAYAFMGASFLSAVMVFEYPSSPWLWPAIAGSYALAVGTGVLRIASGNHFLSDVLVGAAIGALYGWLVPYLHTLAR